MAKRKQVIDPEVQKKQNLLSSYDEMMRGIELGIISKNPTRLFEIDQRVHWGNHKEVYVREIHENGMFYLVEAIDVKRERDKPGQNEYHYMEWYYLFPYMCATDTLFAQPEEYYIRLLNSSVESLLYLIYGTHAGVDFDAEYQRDHVWTMKDKVDLIDSIFNNVDIGKFVFVQRNERVPGKYYEILDGKQRLTALREFYEDRFSYKGVVFSRLSGMDKHKILGHPITYGFLENPDKRGIYTSFIKLNTCGKPMDHKHIDKVKKLLNDLK